MDPDALAGMVFTLIIIAMILGFIVTFPLAKRVGLLIEQKLGEKPGRSAASSTLATDELRRVREDLQALESQVRTIVERQQFVEELVARHEPKALPTEVES